MPKVNKLIKRFFRRLVNLLLEPVKGYTRFVSLTKIFLIIGALILIAVIIIVPLKKTIQNKFRVTFSDISLIDENGKPVMRKPVFQGVDNGGQPYNLTAESATQESEDMLVLNKVESDMSMKDGTWLSLKADKGSFLQKEEVLDLEGNVNLISSEGYEFRTQAASINIKEGYAFGSDPVEVQSNSGTIKARGFVIENKGDVIIFNNQVETKLFP